MNLANGAFAYLFVGRTPYGTVCDKNWKTDVNCDSDFYMSKAISH